MALPKVELRKTIKNLLSQTTKEEFEKHNLEISNCLVQMLIKHAPKKEFCLGGFSPIQKEPMWHSAMTEFPKLAFPRIEKDKIDFYLASFSELEDSGEYSIREPNLTHKKVTPDILLIPGIAFTRDGQRLGRGGGHYDLYLSGFKGLRIGVCFESQIVGNVFAEPHDQRVNFVVTEFGATEVL
jgi:5-formyltetrahydrofolate cyclo-ligase